MGGAKLIQEPISADGQSLDDESQVSGSDPVGDVASSSPGVGESVDREVDPLPATAGGDTGTPGARGEPTSESPAAEQRSVQEETEDDADVEPLEEETDEADAEEDVEPLEEDTGEDDGEELDKSWYILKVQSNREQSICDGLRRRVAIANLDCYFGDVIVPTEDVAEFKNGKRRVVKRKLYPGYIVVNMVINDETWFLVRETPGIGDFTGSAGRPTPMLPHEVERIVKSSKPDDEGGEPIKTAIPFKQGDRVRIKDGTFENFEGEIEDIDEANGRVTVMINIFGRSTPVELEHWQIDAV